MQTRCINRRRCLPGTSIRASRSSHLLASRLSLSIAVSLALCPPQASLPSNSSRSALRLLRLSIHLKCISSLSSRNFTELALSEVASLLSSSRIVARRRDHIRLVDMFSSTSEFLKPIRVNSIAHRIKPLQLFTSVQRLIRMASTLVSLLISRAINPSLSTTIIFTATPSLCNLIRLMPLTQCNKFLIGATVKSSVLAKAIVLMCIARTRASLSQGIRMVRCQSSSKSRCFN